MKIYYIQRGGGMKKIFWKNEGPWKIYHKFRNIFRAPPPALIMTAPYDPLYSFRFKFQIQIQIHIQIWIWNGVNRPL
jgi:hypothetical protein